MNTCIISQEEQEHQAAIVKKALSLEQVCATGTQISFDSHWKNICNGEVDFNQPIESGEYVSAGNHSSYILKTHEKVYYLESLLDNRRINIYVFFKKYKTEFEINFGLEIYPKLIGELLNLDEEKAIELIDYIIKHQQKVTKNFVCFLTRMNHRLLLERNKFALMEKIIEMRIFGSCWNFEFEMGDFCSHFIKAISTQKNLKGERCTTLIQNNILAGFFDGKFKYPQETSQEVHQLTSLWFSAYSHGVLSLKLIILRQIIYKTRTPVFLKKLVEKLKIPKKYPRPLYQWPSFDVELERKIEERAMSAKRKHK